jgi:quercetin dioxygenase-like cupin family protein
MDTFEHKHGSFLFTAGDSERTSHFAEGTSPERGPIPASALAIDGGEHLLHFRDQGNIFIKLGSATGSQNLALGTQQVMVGIGIPVHRHFNVDEVFYVLEGRGTLILNDVRHVLEKGAAVFISRNAWHGFENPEHELLLLWVVTPAGLDGFFRETCNPPGAPRKQLSLERIKEIAIKKYGTEYR